MYFETYLVAEKPLDGKPLTVCTMDPWWGMEYEMCRDKPEFDVKAAAKHLYDLFNHSNDTTETGINPEELSELKGNGVYIIPKTKDSILTIAQYIMIKGN